MASRDTVAALRACTGELTAHVRAQVLKTGILISETPEIMDCIIDFTEAVETHTGRSFVLPEINGSSVDNSAGGTNGSFVNNSASGTDGSSVNNSAGGTNGSSELRKSYFAACDFARKAKARLAELTGCAKEGVAVEKETVQEANTLNYAWVMAVALLHHAVAAELLLAKLDRTSNS